MLAPVGGPGSTKAAEPCAVPVNPQKAATDAELLRAKGTTARRSIGEWVLGETIGLGSSGKVRMARHARLPSLQCVVKCIRRPEVDKPTTTKQELYIINEGAINVLLEHPNIVQLLDFYCGAHHVYIFFEHVPGEDLIDYINRQPSKRLAEKRARHILRHVVSAIDYVHRNHVVHRDLKLENIRYDERTGAVKVLDFGFASFYVRGAQLRANCGSPCYAAPEIYDNAPYHGPGVDVWSLGVCLYGMTMGSLPFNGTSFDDMKRQVMAAELRLDKSLSHDLRDLIRRMICPSTGERISMAGIVRHPWLNRGYAHPPVDHFEWPDRSVVATVDSQLAARIVNATPVAAGKELLQVAFGGCKRRRADLLNGTGSVGPKTVARRASPLLPPPGSPTSSFSSRVLDLLLGSGADAVDPELPAAAGDPKKLVLLAADPASDGPLKPSLIGIVLNHSTDGASALSSETTPPPASPTVAAQGRKSSVAPNLGVVTPADSHDRLPTSPAVKWVVRLFARTKKGRAQASLHVGSAPAAVPVPSNSFKLCFRKPDVAPAVQAQVASLPSPRASAALPSPFLKLAATNSWINALGDDASVAAAQTPLASPSSSSLKSTPNLALQTILSVNSADTLGGDSTTVAATTPQSSPERRVRSSRAQHPFAWVSGSFYSWSRRSSSADTVSTKTGRSEITLDVSSPDRSSQGDSLATGSLDGQAPALVGTESHDAGASEAKPALLKLSRATFPRRLSLRINTRAAGGASLAGAPTSAESSALATPINSAVSPAIGAFETPKMALNEL